MAPLLAPRDDTKDTFPALLTTTLLEESIPVARKIDALAHTRALLVIGHVTAGLIASRIARHDDSDVVRLDEYAHRAIRIIRRDVIGRKIAFVHEPLEIELEPTGLASEIPRRLPGLPPPWQAITERMGNGGNTSVPLFVYRGNTPASVPRVQYGEYSLTISMRLPAGPKAARSMPEAAYGARASMSAM